MLFFFQILLQFVLYRNNHMDDDEKDIEFMSDSVEETSEEKL